MTLMTIQRIQGPQLIAFLPDRPFVEAEDGAEVVPCPLDVQQTMLVLPDHHGLLGDDGIFVLLIL